MLTQPDRVAVHCHQTDLLAGITLCAGSAASEVAPTFHPVTMTVDTARELVIWMRLVKASLTGKSAGVVSQAMAVRHPSKARLIAAAAAVMLERLAAPVGLPARARLANVTNPATVGLVIPRSESERAVSSAPGISSRRSPSLVSVQNCVSRR